MGAKPCGASCTTLRGERRVGVLLCVRCAAAVAGIATTSSFALPASACESGGCVPQADRSRDAGAILKRETWRVLCARHRSKVVRATHATLDEVLQVMPA